MNFLKRNQVIFSWSAVMAMVLLFAGCEAVFNNKLLTRHFSNEDKQVSAQKRWNDFRGDVRLKMVGQHLDAGRYDEAEKILSEARELLTDRPEVHRLSARLYFETEQFQMAQSAINELLALQPVDADGQFLAGRIADRLADYELATGHFRAAIDAAPDRLTYHAALAECLVNQGRSDEAIGVILAANGYESSLPLRQLAMEICQSVGNQHDAAVHARAVCRLADNDEDTQIRAGMVLASCGESEDAVEVLMPFVAAAAATLDRADASDSADAPFVSGLLLAYARNCMAVNRDDAALKALKPLIRRSPGDELAWSLYCRAALRTGDLDLALKTVETFNRRNKPILEMLVLQAYVCYLRGDAEMAIETANRALEIDSQFEPAHLIKSKASRSSQNIAKTAPVDIARGNRAKPLTDAKRPLVDSSDARRFVDTSYISSSDEEAWN